MEYNLITLPAFASDRPFNGMFFGHSQMVAILQTPFFKDKLIFLKGKFYLIQRNKNDDNFIYTNSISHLGGT